MVELIAFEEGVDRGTTAMVADPIEAGMFINSILSTSAL